MQPHALIPLMLLLPLIGGLALTALPSGRADLVKRFAFFWASVTFVISLLLAQQFDFASGQMQFRDAIRWVDAFGLSFGYGLDSVSMWLVLLTTFLMPITILGSFTAGKLVEERAKEFFLWLLVLEAAMLGVFVSTDVIFFYICFEFTLIPLYFLIGVFGSTQRLRAARVFFLYTFTGSMLTFAGVLYVAWFNTTLPPELFAGAGRWTFDITTLYGAAAQMSAEQQCWVFFSMLAGFAVKVPLFPVHTWLPLAHTEAPTAGSVVLAGVLLKLGTYAILRLAIPLAPQAAIDWAPLIGTLAVIGILYTALICWVQKDIKKLIAYSSVSHLGFCVLGLFAISETQVIGQAGAVMYMVNHGLSTGALFLCVGMIYERYHTREMAQYSGLGKAMPVWSFFMIFFCFASVGLPGLNGFVGEFLTLQGAFLADGVLGWPFALFAGAGMIFGAMYILYMVGKVVWGEVKLPDAHHDHEGHGGHEGHEGDHDGDTDESQAAPGVNRFGVRDLNLREIVVLTPLAVGCLYLGLFPTTILRTLDNSIEPMTAPAAKALVEANRENAGATRLTQRDAAPEIEMKSISGLADSATALIQEQGADGK